MITALQEADTAERLAARSATGSVTLPVRAAADRLAAAAAARRPASIGRAGRPGPARPRSGASSCSRLPLLVELDDDQARAVRGADHEPGRAGPAAAPDRPSATSGTWSWRSGPESSCPRPETEVMTGWAIDQLRETITCDAATGRSWWSSAPGPAPSPRPSPREVPGAEVHAVESRPRPPPGPSATSPTPRRPCTLADMADALPELDGTVDLVIANPPYIPLEAYDSVAPEARDHDPTLALFSGADGLDAIRVRAATAARLLRPGGLLASSTPRCRASQRLPMCWSAPARSPASATTAI